MASETEHVVETDSSNTCETCNIPSFSKLLQGVVFAANQGQFGMSHQEALGTVTATAAQSLHQKKTQDESLKSSCELPPISQTSSPNSSAVIEENLLFPSDNSFSQNGTIIVFSTPPSDHKSSNQEIPIMQTPEVLENALNTPKSDKYNWRKYGQKQVKSSETSRSYFRCTNSSCSAKKKVQHSDESGKIVEVVYKGNHNHDPPPRVIKRFGRKKSFNESSVGNLNPCREEPKEEVLQLTCEYQDSHLNNSVGALKSDIDEQHVKIANITIRHETKPSMLAAAKAEHGMSSNRNELPWSDTMNERDIPIKKRRLKESGKEMSQSVYRTFKEPKIIVHASADSGISSDGYRWRKYGQKIVKGSPYPRSYYRCSSNGCPVRKHVERATDGSIAMIVMYEGEHDHDKPVSKKQQRNSLKSSISVNSTTDIVTNNVPLLTSKEENSTSPSRESSVQPREVSYNDCEQKTLLTVGIELESC